VTKEVTADNLTWVVFDPVSETGVLFIKASSDRTLKGDICEKAIIGCATEEKAREVLVKMFGDSEWTHSGRWIVRSGTPEQLEKLMQDTGCRDVYDGEKVVRR